MPEPKQLTPGFCSIKRAFGVEPTRPHRARTLGPPETKAVQTGLLGTPQSASRIAAQKELEVILARQLADCLAVPIFLVDAEGTLLFYNEPAEGLLGRRFEETGALTPPEWATAFIPTDSRGNPLPPEKLPLMIALRDRRPAHADFWIRALDRAPHYIHVTAFPLIGRSNRFLGAVALFWEVEPV